MNKLMLSSVLLLILTNVVVLSGVAYNRSANPVVSVELTERELPLRHSYSAANENSGTAVSLTWQVLQKNQAQEYFPNRYSTPAWLDNAKLTELGFDLEEISHHKAEYRYNRKRFKAEVVLVMEYQGESYQQALLSAEQHVDALRNQSTASSEDTTLQSKLKRSEQRLIKLQVSDTRLYVIDAGVNDQALAQKYNDKNKYLFMRGVIGVSWNNNAIEGRVNHVLINELHVPLPYSKLLTSLTKGEKRYSYMKTPIAPRYKIMLNIGKRLEPWIERIEAGN